MALFVRSFQEETFWPAKFKKNLLQKWTSFVHLSNKENRISQSHYSLHYFL